jgi:hypothetical protein
VSDVPPRSVEQEVDDLRDQALSLAAELVEVRATARHLAWQVRTDSIGALDLARALEQLSEGSND